MSLMISLLPLLPLGSGLRLSRTRGKRLTPILISLGRTANKHLLNFVERCIDHSTSLAMMARVPQLAPALVDAVLGIRAEVRDAAKRALQAMARKVGSYALESYLSQLPTPLELDRGG